MGALPDYKDIVGLIKAGATIEAQEKIMDLRVAAVDLQEENLRLREQVKQLDEQLRLTSAMVFKKPFYYHDGDDTPYCPVCWEKDRKSIHLNGPTGDHGHYLCPVCKYDHFIKGRPATVAVISRPSRIGRGLIG